MLYLILFLVIVIAAGGFVIKNLLAKVEKYEEDIQLKDEFLTKFRNMVTETSNKMQSIDIKFDTSTQGAFEADDETGVIFKQIRDLTFGLDSYFKNYLTEEDVKK